MQKEQDGTVIIQNSVGEPDYCVQAVLCQNRF